MLGADDPYQEPQPPQGWETAEPSAADAEALLRSAHHTGIVDNPVEMQAASDDADDLCAISPCTIWEAILFVGQPGNQPIKAHDIAKLMRGVTASELDDLVLELNQTYAAENAPYRINSVGDGYRMELAPENRVVEARMAGRVKEAKLSQSHLETLAIVAYHQPVTAKELLEKRGRPSGGVLRQLVRRGLITVEPGESRGQEKYRTTSRFLQVFRLKGLSDLPQVQDLERSL